MAEALEVDLQAVGVEADGDVELEAGGDGLAGGGDVAGLEGDDAGGVVDGVVGARRLRGPGDGDQDGAGDGLPDVAGPGIEGGAVGLRELEGGGGCRRRCRSPGRARWARPRAGTTCSPWDRASGSRGGGRGAPRRRR